jgi:pSer/pThr/pTyr-binding forkhead associated (FHA) protein
LKFAGGRHPKLQLGEAKMVDQKKRSNFGTVVLHLLDSAQGHVLHSWRVSDRSPITVGRNDDNDVVIADPHVSRLHVTLVFQDGGWNLISLGRHGTLIGDRAVSESRLVDGLVFRLGANGPMLRFDASANSGHRSETLDSIDPDMLNMLDIDQARKEQEVEQITDNELFRQLLEQSKQKKSS